MVRQKRSVTKLFGGKLGKRQSAVFIVFFALIGVILLLTAFAASPAPPSGGYFTTLPPGSTLPTESDCAARVARHNWEPKPQNLQENRTVPSAVTLPDLPDYNTTANLTFKPRITGNYTGTTDEIIQWASCKWGFHDDIFRAQAYNESSWDMAAAGDFTSDVQYCPEPKAWKNGQCGQSFGLLQNKWRYNKPAYPDYRYMTAFHLDYSLMKLRSCYEGWAWVSGGVKGDLEGCLGAWFSGSWHDSAAEDYISRWRNAYANKPWRSWADAGDRPGSRVVK